LGPENHRLKFSGNAQRRRRTALLFHGTLLNTFDLALLARCLQHPSAEPEYRAGRPHSDFITKLNLAPADLRQALTKAWEVTGSANSISEGAVADLAATRFARADWIFRR
jgi:lipoate-protein ligase A